MDFWNGKHYPHMVLFVGACHGSASIAQGIRQSGSPPWNAPAARRPPQRELEVKAFVPEEYWTVTAELTDGLAPAAVRMDVVAATLPLLSTLPPPPQRGGVGDCVPGLPLLGFLGLVGVPPSFPRVSAPSGG